MKSLKSVVVLLALLASLLGGYLVGLSAPNVPLPLSALHQTAVHQLLATGGGGDPGTTFVPTHTIYAPQLLATGGGGNPGGV